MANGLIALTTRKKITPLQAAIYKAHVEAKRKDVWDYEGKFPGSQDEFKTALLEKKTFKTLWDSIEIQYCSVGQIMMAHPDILDVVTYSYVQNMMKGFKFFLYEYGIQ